MRSIAPVSTLAALCLASLLEGVQAKWTPPKNYALEISPNGRYFQDTDGKPFFWQADTAWLLTHRLNYTEAEHYLEDRASKGYNIVLNVGFAQGGIDSPNRNGDLFFHDLDVTKPNEPYWEYVDSIAKLAWEKYKIRMAMVPAWGSYGRANIDPGVITAENGGPFGRFIGERYPYMVKFLFADHNPQWADQGALTADYARGGIVADYPNIDYTPVWDAVAEGIVAGERAATGNRRHSPLLTVHPRNQWTPGAPVALASAEMGDRDWLNFDCAQSGHADQIPRCPSGWWNARRGYETIEVMWNISTNGRKRPVIDNEPHYEERFSNRLAVAVWNASDIRTGSWQTALSGAVGYSYGNDNVMQMYIPGIYDPAESGNVRPWDVSLQAPGAGQLQYLKKAILDRGQKSFFNRIPAQDIIVSEAGDDDLRVTAMRDSKGSWIMVYTPTGLPFSIDTTSLKGRRTKASWFNPLDGSYTGFDFNDATGSREEKTFTPPTEDDHVDWALILEA